MDPDTEIVPGGGGWGKEYAELRKHVLPAALYLVILTLLLLGLLICRWPHCELDGCEDTLAEAKKYEAILDETETISNETTSNETTSNETTSGETTSGETTEDKATKDEATGNTEGSEKKLIEISTLERTSGTICGGTEVKITGSGFSQGQAKVRFGGFAARVLEYQGDNSLVVRTPAHWEGAADVTVKINNNSNTLSKGFNYVCPQQTQDRLLLLVVIAGMLGGTLHALRSLFWYTGNRNLRVSWLWMYYLLPLSGAAIGTIFFLVFVAGFFSPHEASDQSYFVMVGVAALVGMFSAQAVEKLKKISEAILTSVPPAADQTPKPVALTEVKPPTGPTSGGTSVTLIGTGFAPGATVTFGGAAATGVKVTSTQIDAVTPPHNAGKVDVEVCNPDSGTAKKAAGFEYLGPLALTAIEPATGLTTVGTPVVLTGTGFAPGAAVTFDSAAATDVKVTSDRINAVTPPHVAGKVNVEVGNPDGGTAKLPAGFEYVDQATDVAPGPTTETSQPPVTPAPPPALTSVEPPTGPTAVGTPVILTGTGFAADATVTFDGTAATDVKVTSTRIDAVTPPHAAGKVDVEVRNPDGGTANMPAGFEYV